MMTTSDKDLLELAAKAAGVILEYADDEGLKPYDSKTSVDWNPLTDDGDALRLAVKLKLPFNITDRYARCIWGSFGNGERCDEFHSMEGATNDPYEATRRAIVRAAAEIGQTK